MARLDELGTIITGNTPKTADIQNYASDDILFVKPSDISDSEITHITSSEFYISEYARSNARIIPANSVLVTCIGIIGKVAITDTECAFNQQINAIIPNEKCLPTYLAYAIQNHKQELQDTANAAVVPIINKSQFSSLQINVPSLPVQTRIVQTLDAVTTLIAVEKIRLAKLDELVKSRFIELFGDPIDNPKEWTVSKIGEIVTDVRYGTSRPATEGGKYPYLRMNNLTADGHLDLKDLKYIDIPDAEIEKCIVRKGDVLFNRTNSIDLVGKTCVFNLDDEMVIAGYIIRVRLNDSILPVFLSCFMNTTPIKKLLRSMAKGAVNQANINAQELQSIKLYIPPIELQNEFAAFVEQTDKLKLAVKQNLEKLETLKKSLMQKYFG